MKWACWLIGFGLLLFIVDLAVSCVGDWAMKVKRDKAARKWGLSPFNYGKEKKW